MCQKVTTNSVLADDLPELSHVKTSEFRGRLRSEPADVVPLYPQRGFASKILIVQGTLHENYSVRVVQDTTSDKVDLVRQIPLRKKLILRDQRELRHCEVTELPDCNGIPNEVLRKKGQPHDFTLMQLLTYFPSQKIRQQGQNGNVLFMEALPDGEVIGPEVVPDTLTQLRGEVVGGEVVSKD